MLSLLHKTLGKEFYAQHAGLFLFIFYLSFGTVEPGQLLSYHKSLLIAICSTPLLFAACSALWLLYTIKCILFVRKQSKLGTYRFLELLSSAPRPFQLRSWAILYAFLFLPILIYVIVLIIIGLSYGYYWSVLCSILLMGGLLMVMTGYTYLTGKYNFIQWTPVLNLSLPEFKKPFWTWPVLYVLQQQTLMFLVCKVLSFLLFKAILWMFADVGGDTRVSLLAVLAAILTHTVLISTLVKHESTSLAFRKSLPIPATKSMFSSLLLLVILFSPELLLYFQTVHFDSLAILQGLLFAMAGLFSFKTMLGGLKQDTDYVKFILFLFAASSMAILAHLVLPYSAGLLLLSVIYFYYTYYRIDLKEVDTED